MPVAPGMLPQFLSRRRRILFGEGVDPNAQTMVMDTTGGFGTTVISNGGRTVDYTENNFGYAYDDTGASDKDFTAGGKFMVECTVDAVVAATFYGLGIYDPAQTVSTNYVGNNDGAGVLLMTTTGLGRVYHGPADSNWDNQSPQLSITNGSVVTMAVNLDDDEITYYVDGVTSGTFTLLRVTPTSNNLRPVLKAYGACTQTLNPVIQYPVDGFVPWL